MPLLISDANILIDFDVAGLLEALFQLPEDLAVPDILYEDELREQHGDLPERGLRLLSLTSSSVSRVVELGTLYRRPSRLDLAALVLAQQETCALLTGDRHLRDAAVKEGVEVHGTLWLAEKMWSHGIIDGLALRQAFQHMQDHGRRLPWSEVSKLLVKIEEK